MKGEYSVNVFSNRAVDLIHAHERTYGGRELTLGVTRYNAHPRVTRPGVTRYNTSSRPPWFIYMAYQSIHEPYQVNMTKFAPRYDSDTSFHSWSKGQQTLALMMTCLDDGISNVTGKMNGPEVDFCKPDKQTKVFTQY